MLLHLMCFLYKPSFKKFTETHIQKVSTGIPIDGDGAVLTELLLDKITIYARMSSSSVTGGGGQGGGGASYRPENLVRKICSIGNNQNGYFVFC